MFFNIIRIIGPINSPGTPDILNPVYMAIKVNIGCIPILLLTILGSINCLAISTTTYIINNDNPRDKFPLIDEYIAQGTRTVPEPSIGSASTNPINNAIIKGNPMSNPIKLNIYNPISTIKNDITIIINSALR